MYLVVFGKHAWTLYRVILMCGYILFNSVLFGQDINKVARAERISSKIEIDGKLEESCWGEGYKCLDFIQFEPNVNDAPNQPSEIMIRYDDHAIFIGAKLLENDGGRILRQLSNRDESENTDLFAIMFDTYQDGVNAFRFEVTAAGVQKDAKYNSQGLDESWNAVWESAVTLDDQGWYVEMKIPYFNLRFSNESDQVWGLQIMREIRRLREINLWNKTDPNIQTFVGQFGKLEGLKDIKTPLRFSATPYLSAYYDNSFVLGEGDSFSDATSYSAGVDIKLGLSDAFTLDMTLIPDFGQTISDQLVLNLSPFEVFFEENRPFFTEGLELFNKGRLFHTRRVGGRPIGYFEVYDKLESDENVISNPTETELINATKISGRTSNGTGIGFFNGITAEQHARVRSLDGEERRIKTSPLVNYNVAVIDQTLKNNSFVTLMNTNVTRFGDDYDANVTGLFTELNDNDQRFGFRGSAAYSTLYGAPDLDDGYTYFLEAGKYGGVYTYNVGYGVESENYNPNDLGFLFSPNEVSYTASASYNQYSPKNPKMNFIRHSIFLRYQELFDPNVFNFFHVNLRSFFLFKSRNAFGVNLTHRPKSHDYFEPRTTDFNRYLTIPAWINGGGFFSSDYRKVFAFDIDLFYRWYNESERSDYEVSFEPRIRLNDKFSIIYEIGYILNFGDKGYVSSSDISIEGFTEEDVLIGIRDRKRLENQLSAKYIFNSKMGLNLRLRHYWDKVKYNGFEALRPNSDLVNLNYEGGGNIGGIDFNRNFSVLNLDAQLQWRFAPGSDLFLVWKSQIANFGHSVDRQFLQSISDLLDERQNHSISLRAVYFLDYNTIANKYF